MIDDPSQVQKQKDAASASAKESHAKQSGEGQGLLQPPDDEGNAAGTPSL